MNIGLGLPTTMAGISGDLLVEWARRADAGPFSSLGVLDRIAYQNYEPFTALAAASAQAATSPRSSASCKRWIPATYSRSRA